MTKCSRCESLDIIKHGFNYNNNSRVQKYKCLDCRKIFSYPDRLPQNHVSSEIVSLCLDLYLKGLSYRVIKQQLLEQFEIKVSHVTIYNWIQQYTSLIKKYTDSLNPNLSAVWQMDETVIKFKGKISKKMESSRAFWCWNCIDTATRYSVDMYLAYNKNQTDAFRFFDRIRQSVKSTPEVISTDGNNAYIKPIKRYYPNARHVIIKHISIKPNTSFIERFHGSIKNRTKTMRCFAEFTPCQNWITLFQIYYNFLRPHMALDGKTPAQVADINIKFSQRWISLIRTALLVVHNF